MYKIAVVDFPCIDNRNEHKERPVLVLTKAIGGHHLLVVAYMTTQMQKRDETDILLESRKEYFKKTGLSKDSLIKLHKLTIVQFEDLKYTLGELSENFVPELHRKMMHLFQISTRK